MKIRAADALEAAAPQPETSYTIDQIAVVRRVTNTLIMICEARGIVPLDEDDRAAISSAIARSAPQPEPESGPDDSDLLDYLCDLAQNGGFILRGMNNPEQYCKSLDDLETLEIHEHEYLGEPETVRQALIRAMEEDAKESVAVPTDNQDEVRGG